MKNEYYSKGKITGKQENQIYGTEQLGLRCDFHNEEHKTK